MVHVVHQAGMGSATYLLHIPFLTIFTLLLLLITYPPTLARPAPSILPQHKRAEIRSYQTIADDIIKYSLKGAGQNQSYNRLATFTDTFGARIAGSENLERAIDYMLNVLNDDGLENVHGEEALVTHWVRNKEYAVLLSPRNYSFTILGLGSSVGTPPEGITAEAVVVCSFKELDDQGDNLRGKIVIYNQDYEGYPVSVAYRAFGAQKAAVYGAVAVLIRTIAPFSIYSPHTGWQDYKDGIPKIPSACITIEDAAMFYRMQQRGQQLKILLHMEAQNLPSAVSRNTIAEITGSVYPEQVVVVSGHLDSWDVGQGAMDDGGGAFISWQALSIIKDMKLPRPKRTLRMIMWTDEESGGAGSESYYNQHQNESDNFNILFESDMGVFTPYGIQFTGSSAAKSVMQAIGQLLVSINASLVEDNGGETDTGWWSAKGVPLASLANHNEHYFYFHHSNGDTMEVLDPVQMNLCSAVWAVYAYVLADLDEMLPRN